MASIWMVSAIKIYTGEKLENQVKNRFWQVFM